MITTVRDFWDKQPCNIRHGTAEIGTKEYFDQVEARKYFVEPHLPKFADFENWNGKNVLEIGCGIGTESINFVRHGATLTIIELSKKSLDLCKKRFEVYGLEADFILGNAEYLDVLIKDKKFDLVWAWGSIHHTPFPERIIEGIKKVLKPDGELRCMLYSKISYKLFWAMHTSNDWDMGRCGEIIRKNAEAQSGCPVAYTYSFSDIERLLNGFIILDMRKDHIFTWDIPNYKRHTYVKDEAWKNVPDETLRDLEKELGWHTLVRARIARAL